MEKNIIALLNKNLRVIIPDFGAFIIRQKQPRIIVFNEFLRYNDGLLIDYITNTEGIDREVAEQRVSAYAEDGTKLLNAGKDFVIDGLGTLHKETSGKINFVDAGEGNDVPSINNEETVKNEVPVADAVTIQAVKTGDIPVTRVSKTKGKTATRVAKTKDKPATRVAKTKDKPATRVVKTKDIPEPRIAKTKPVTRISKTRDKPVTPALKTKAESRNPLPQTKAETVIAAGKAKTKPGISTGKTKTKPGIPLAKKTRINPDIPVIKTRAKTVIPIIKESDSVSRKEHVSSWAEMPPAEETPVAAIASEPKKTIKPADTPIVVKQPEPHFSQFARTLPAFAGNRINQVLAWVLLFLFANAVIFGWFVYKDKIMGIFRKGTVPAVMITDSLFRKLADSVRAAALDTSLVYKEAISEEASGDRQDQSLNSRFYIVAGCFSAKVNADELVNSLKGLGYKAEQFGKIGNLYAVCFASFSDKDQAVNELRRIREKVPDAWMTRF